MRHGQEWKWTQDQQTCPYNTGGTRFFSSAEGSYLYKQPILLVCLNLTCQSGFFVRFHFNYLFHMTGLAALAIMMTKLANDHCQLTTVYYCMGLTLSRLPVFFSVRWLSVHQYFLSIVVCQLTIFHDIPVLINSSVKTVSGTLKKTL